MDNREWLNFECSIMDMAEGIDNPTELEELADNLHQHIENALIDYADDNGFGDDYSPCY